MLASLLNALPRRVKYHYATLNFVRNNATTLFIVATSLPLLGIFIYYQTFKLNYPQHEDLLSMTFIRHWSTNSWESLLDEWVSHGFGHRYPFTRTVSLIAALLNGGELDITHTGILGIVFLALFYGLFTFLLYRSRVPLIYILPLAFWLFQPQLKTYMFWSLINQLYMPSLFFSLVAIWLLTKDGTGRLVAALLCVIVAVGAFSSGLLGYGAGALILLLRRKWIYLMIWCLIAAGTAALYFRNYTQPGWGLPEFRPYENSLSIWLLIHYITLYIGGVLHFDSVPVSASTIYNSKLWGSYLLGLTCYALIAYTLIVAWGGYIPTVAQRWSSSMQRKFDWWQLHPRIRLFVTGFVALLFVTIYMIINGRTTVEDGSQVFSDRLRIYPFTIVSMAYLLALWLTGRFRHRVFVASLGLSVFFYLMSYYYHIDARIREKRFHMTSLYNYLHNEPSYLNDFGTWGGNNQKYNKPNVDSAVLAGVYRPTDPDFMKGARLVEPHRKGIPKLSVAYDSTTNRYIFSSNNFNNSSTAGMSYYLLLHSTDYKFVLPLSVRRSPVTYFLKTGKYYYGDVETIVNATALPEGKYRVGLLAHINKPYYTFQADSITIRRTHPGEWW